MGNMKSFNILLAVLLIITACKQQEKYHRISEKGINETTYGSFRSEISHENVLQSNDMLAKYKQLGSQDTIGFTFSAKVIEVCQAKGCWMKLALGNGEESLVKFKDYGFFVPKDISGKTVIVSGKAFLDVMSVEDRKHFAEDSGKPKAEIDTIRSVSNSYAFEADGVLIRDSGE